MVLSMQSGSVKPRQASTPSNCCVGVLNYLKHEHFDLEFQVNLIINIINGKYCGSEGQCSQNYSLPELHSHSSFVGSLVLQCFKQVILFKQYF